jgi:hypothetical protein
MKYKENKFKIIKKELTPQRLRCSIGACPAVFLIEGGNFLIIGKKISPDLQNEISDKIADDEFAIVIHQDFFEDIHD